MAAKRDPRPYQIGALGLLLAWGIAGLDLEVDPACAGAGLAAALLTQLVCNRFEGVRFDPRSALISGLSLALLLRTDAAQWAALAGVLAISSKYLLRVRGKHVFNPTCFALVALIASSDRVWASAGQWGSAAIAAFAFAGLGILVLARSRRSDATVAFLAFWSALVLGRALWLGDPLAIPLHQLQTGSLLLFAFFMISDPRTLPDARPARLVFAAAVAASAGWIQFGLFQPNALLWALAGCAPLAPFLDRLFPAERYEWRPAQRPSLSLREENDMRVRAFATVAALLMALLPATSAWAFCGFYVAKADAQLFNRASQVVLVRDGNRTVVTMSNDFQGDPSEFAVVIPVPTAIRREQIHIGERAVIEHLDAYTAPRLVEYHDPDPCLRLRSDMAMERSASGMASPAQRARGKAHGVTIEAAYTVGEYDIVILSAEQSSGLAAFLRESGYRLPKGAEPVLKSYLLQGMRFFVARVNLVEQARLGFSYLRPLQVAYETPKFMLPIRLGTLNANGPQELFVYALTRKGRVETTNYRTTRLPSDLELPVFVRNEFADFYRALFDEQVRRESMRTVFLEYAWDMNWCDPCAADPLSDAELRSLGVFWVRPKPVFAPKSQARDVFVTRLHVRYDADHFPADLRFQETGDRRNFQGRYVLRHPWSGEALCPAADTYRVAVQERQEQQAQTLARLTGWDLDEVRRKANLGAREWPRRWWEAIWD